MKITTLTSYLALFLLLTQQSSAECDAGWYGHYCKQKCHCIDNKCNSTTGKCEEGCDKGFFGPICQQECEAGWYGHSCKYQCHCVNHGICHPVTGDCINGCAKGYFGPSCQQGQITGFVVATKNDSDVNNVVCHDSALAESTDQSIADRFCNPRPVKLLMLSWTARKSICSIMVAGGSDVAVRQRTSSATNMINAGKAVDGDTSHDIASCYSSVEVESDIRQWFTISFEIPQKIYRVEIFQSNEEEYWDRLSGFTIEVKRGDKIIIKYNDETKPASFYKLNVPYELTGVTAVTIRANHRSNTLTLCEVRVLGDPDCRHGRYGPICKDPCKCKTGFECFPTTGLCPYGCPKGFWGIGCTKGCGSQYFGEDCIWECNSRCVDRECEPVTGVCSGCVAGYQGSFCREGCPQTRWGGNCLQFCSVNCTEGQCDDKDGKCFSCILDKTGDFCSEDPPPGNTNRIIMSVLGCMFLFSIIIILYCLKKKHKKKADEFELSSGRQNVFDVFNSDSGDDTSDLTSELENSEIVDMEPEVTAPAN